MAGNTQTTTYPTRKRIRLPPDAYHKSEAWYFVTICCRGKRALLKQPAARDLVQEELQRTAAALKVELAAYTILSDHLHMVCSAGRTGLVGFIQAFKGRAAACLRRRLRVQSLWQKSFFDHKLRSPESLRRKCEYVWMNPVRRGFVRTLANYRWSGQRLTG